MRLVYSVKNRSRFSELITFEGVGEIYNSDDIADPCNEVRSPDVFDVDTNNASILIVPRTDNDPVGVYKATALKSDLLNWTDGGKVVNETGKRYYSATHWKYEDTWYVICGYSDAGVFDLYTGSSLDSLVEYGSNPVYSGQGTTWETYVRHPKLIHNGAEFVLFYDGRTTAPKGIEGGIGFATSQDCITWVRWDKNPLVQHDTYVYDNYQHAPTLTKLPNGDWYIGFGDTWYLINPAPQWLPGGNYVYVTKDFNTFKWLTPEKHGQGSGSFAGSQRDLFYNDYDKKMYYFGTSGITHIIAGLSKKIIR